ncbi:MAG: TolC family protein [Desulfobulbaceae bacterium]|nr:TolC family protein [Desulfobulbaceae bacterium]
MKTVLCHRGTPLFFCLLAVLCCSCVKQFSPNQAMSSPKIAGETKVKELMESRDQSLVQTAVPVKPLPTKVAIPLKLTLQEAVLIGLEQNQNFHVERLKPTINRSAEEVERAAFDPLLTAKASHSHGTGYLSNGTDSLASTTTSSLRQAVDRETTSTGVGLSQATSLGATITLNADQEKELVPDANSSSRQQNWDLTITQALLRGRGPDVTLARLRQSRLDTEMSLYELQGTAETLVANIEQAYWDLVLADRNLATYQQSLTIANQQLEEVMERIKVGAIAENEAASAEAEAAERYQQLVSARGTLAKAKLNLLHLVNPGGQADWQAEITLSDTPELSDMSVDAVDHHVALAMSKRADLNQARLLVRRNDLEVTQTKNGLLPKLDLFLSLGGSRYSYSFAGHDDMTTNDSAYAGGLSLEFPLKNRESKAKHAAASWSLEQANAALSNMEQLVQVEVRSAHVDVEQASAQVKAATATATLREKALALEQEKFRLGRSTTIQVAQAQRDLLESQILQSKAVVGARKAMLDLHRLEGSLLTHLGIMP